MNAPRHPHAAHRHVVLHNHLFKNAGTSVDHILQQNFGPRWHTKEFSGQGNNNSQAVADWIKATPAGVAYSSHTMLGPLPRMDGIRIYPILLLRDPIERIASAYRFERAQDAKTRGAVLAKKHGFAGYVHERLSFTGDRQCQNFQTQRLASLRPDSPGTELQRAQTALREVAEQGVVGLVSDFNGAMRRLSALLLPHYPNYAWRPVTANASGSNNAHAVSPEMKDLLSKENADDLALLRYARTLPGQTSAVVGTLQEPGIA